MSYSYQDFKDIIGKEVVAIKNPKWGFAYSSQAPYDGKTYVVTDYHQLEYDEEEDTFFAMLELEGVAGWFSAKYFQIL